MLAIITRMKISCTAQEEAAEGVNGLAYYPHVCISVLLGAWDIAAYT